ncbi:MAG: hypothetical protein PWQ57_2527 [Desulfovibrionales bacterium]|nr:hypothetical protein [Desulfovibrionales bacterium]
MDDDHPLKHDLLKSILKKKKKKKKAPSYEGVFFFSCLWMNGGWS